MDDAVFESRARVLADLEARRMADPYAVSALEDAVASRRWWVSQWPEGLQYVAGLVAQDVQDALIDNVGRWPLCEGCDDAPQHPLHISPELGGPDPVWVCEHSGSVVARLGRLGGKDVVPGGSEPT